MSSSAKAVNFKIALWGVLHVNTLVLIMCNIGNPNSFRDGGHLYLKNSLMRTHGSQAQYEAVRRIHRRDARVVYQVNLLAPVFKSWFGLLFLWLELEVVGQEVAVYCLLWKLEEVQGRLQMEQV